MKARFVIMGLPASGKTTFLAALWHLVEADEAECRLQLESYEGDLSYLNLIAQAWRTFKKVPRTSQVGDVDITIDLVDRMTGEKGSVYFPDLAGETFDAQVESRICRPKFLDDVAASDGLLFFVSADVKGNSLSVVEFNSRMPLEHGDAAAQLEIATEAQKSSDGTDGGKEDLIPPVEWDPKLVSPQVRVVQILSDFLRPPFEPRRRRLAIIISAWDLTRGMGVSPRQWLASQMPLVDQFLRCSGESFEFEIYGVSAQGVDLNDTASVDSVADLSPSRRIQIVGPVLENHDLTSPLVWIMSGE